jgi:hypothetical protein
MINELLIVICYIILSSVLSFIFFLFDNTTEMKFDDEIHHSIFYKITNNIVNDHDKNIMNFIIILSLCFGWLIFPISLIMFIVFILKKIFEINGDLLCNLLLKIELSEYVIMFVNRFKGLLKYGQFLYNRLSK